MGEELRRHARIEAGLSCTVATAEDSFDAQVVNLSRSGAAILTSGQLKTGDSLTLLVERDEGVMSVALTGQVVRSESRANGTLYGVRFDALPPDAENELVMLLRMLAAGRGEGRRADPRISTRISVRCKSAESFLGTLSDLSRGGLSIRSPKRMELNETLTVQFGIEGMPGIVEVSGPVTHVEERDGAFRVGMRFSPLAEETRRRMAALVEILLGLGPRQGVILEDD